MNIFNPFSLLFGLLFSQCSSASTNDDGPRPITPDERINLLKLIKTNNADGIKSFFTAKENLKIDYSLITFKHTDDPEAADIHGFTPLQAAIFYCQKESIDFLLPVQYTAKWTTFSAFGYSNAELAAKHCPKLIIDYVNTGTGYHELFKNLTANQLYNIFVSSQQYPAHIRESIRNFLVEYLTRNPDDKSNLLNEFVDVWIENKTDESPSIALLWKRIEFDVSDINLDEVPVVQGESLKTIALKLLKAGHSNEFKLIWESFDPNDADDLLMNGISHLSPSDFIDGAYRQHNQQNFRPFNDVQTTAENITIFVNSITDLITDSLSGMLKRLEPIIHSFINIGTVQRISGKYLPHFYHYVFSKYPRIDTMIFFTGSRYQIISTGDNEPIDPNEMVSIKNAFREDDPQILEASLVRLHRISNKYNSLNLRLEYKPFKLSLIKAAVMLKKPRILAHLMTKNFGKESLNSSTKFQMTALEMAACYVPDFLIEHIAPIIGSDCQERLKAANNLIAMFTELKFQKCPSGSKNAPVVLKALLTSAVPEEVRCINFGEKDYVQESIKLHHPIEVIQAFWETGLYKDIDAYIYLAVKKGNYRLLEYFVEKLNGADSNFLKYGLINWIRFTDGIPTTGNLKMLEFFISYKETDINARDPVSGQSALSLATQNRNLWIVKRLLLEKDLNVNETDLNSGKTAIHHAVNQFSEIFNDMESEIVSFSQINQDEYHRILIKTVLDEFGLDVIPQAGQAMVTNILFGVFIGWIESLNLRFFGDAEMLEILDLFQKWMQTYSTENIMSLVKLKELARISPNHGFLHNVLLAHPDIDSTIEDSQHNDLIKLTKYRTINLRDNPGAFTEMARAHLRFMKIEAVKGSSKKQKHIALAAISSLIIGSASVGIIRWMI